MAAATVLAEGLAPAAEGLVAGDDHRGRLLSARRLLKKHFRPSLKDISPPPLSHPQSPPSAAPQALRVWQRTPTPPPRAPRPCSRRQGRGSACGPRRRVAGDDTVTGDDAHAASTWSSSSPRRFFCRRSAGAALPPPRPPPHLPQATTLSPPPPPPPRPPAAKGPPPSSHPRPLRGAPPSPHPARFPRPLPPGGRGRPPPPPPSPPPPGGVFPPRPAPLHPNDSPRLRRSPRPDGPCGGVDALVGSTQPCPPCRLKSATSQLPGRNSLESRGPSPAPCLRVTRAHTSPPPLPPRTP